MPVVDDKPTVRRLITDIFENVGYTVIAVGDRATGLKVLSITGDAEDTTLGNGPLPPGIAMLTKPFAMDNLAARIRPTIEGGTNTLRRRWSRPEPG